MVAVDNQASCGAVAHDRPLVGRYRAIYGQVFAVVFRHAGQDVTVVLAVPQAPVDDVVGDGQFVALVSGGTEAFRFADVYGQDITTNSGGHDGRNLRVAAVGRSILREVDDEVVYFGDRDQLAASVRRAEDLVQVDAAVAVHVALGAYLPGFEAAGNRTPATFVYGQVGRALYDGVHHTVVRARSAAKEQVHHRRGRRKVVGVSLGQVAREGQR